MTAEPKKTPPSPSAPASRARAWTDEESSELRRRHGEGQSLRVIASGMGRSKATVGKYASDLGLKFDRAATEAATRVAMIDAKARRHALEQRLLDEVDASLDRMWASMEVGAFNPMGEYSRATLSEPTPQDRKAIAVAVSSLLTSANKLGELNAGRDVDYAKASLTKLQLAMERYVFDVDVDETEDE